MSISLKDGWYVDENNNRWDAEWHTAELAEELSSTLTSCKGCDNCIDCHACYNCVSCAGCEHCTHCNHCSKCDNCVDCLYCEFCHSCSACSRCYSCTHCIICRRCGYCTCCECCVDFLQNPQRIVGYRLGSRSSNPTVYWLEPGKERCVVGCFRGTLDELEAKVKETHKDNPKHLHDYLEFIKAVWA